jgi:hypothetical protein
MHKHGHKVKELGFTGDCGYNQLLYPVEAHTRPLLTWLVQKLPRTDVNNFSFLFIICYMLTHNDKNRTVVQKMWWVVMSFSTAE